MRAAHGFNASRLEQYSIPYCWKSSHYSIAIKTHEDQLILVKFDPDLIADQDSGSYYRAK